MLTSSSTTLTFDASTEPWVVTPRPFWPGVPVCAGPLGHCLGKQVFTERQAGRVHEMGELKLSDLHGILLATRTLTTPSRAMVMLCEPSGMLMPST